MNTHIKNILHSIFQKEDSWKTKLIQEWPTIIGNLSDKITLEKIEQTTLILGVAHPAWIQEFTSLTPLIITTINNHLEYPFVTNIRFKTKKSQKLIWQHAYTTQKKTPTRELTSIEKNAVDKLKDHELKAALISFLQRCKHEL